MASIAGLSPSFWLPPRPKPSSSADDRKSAVPSLELATEGGRLSDSSAFFLGSDIIEGRTTEVDGDDEISVPSFFESGQLMWEISAHTEAFSVESPPLPEIVLTDSSFLSSANPVAAPPVVATHDDVPSSERDAGSCSRNKQPKRILASSYCLELMTDDDGAASSFDEPDARFEFGEGRHDDDDDDEDDEESGCDPTPKLFMVEPIVMKSRLRNGDDEDLDEEFDVKRFARHDWPIDRRCHAPLRTTLDENRDVASLGVIKSAAAIDLRLASWAVDSSSGPRSPMELYGNNINDNKEPLQMEIPVGALVAGEEEDGEASPPTTPRCSVRGMLTEALSRLNRLFYHSIHRQQSKKEREVLKRVRDNCRGQKSSPAVSPTNGLYQRRNDRLRQKMEGMINQTESKSRAMEQHQHQHQSKIVKSDLRLDLRKLPDPASATIGGCLPGSGRLRLSNRLRRSKEHSANRKKTGHSKSTTSKPSGYH